MSYTAWPGSLADRVIQWFRINREEELLTGDLARKFDVPAANVGACLESARAAGVLGMRKGDDGSRGYSD